MNIAVIGVGGVGGYFGGKLTKLLERHRDLNVYFVARNEHLEAIIANGLILDTDQGEMLCKPSLATADISQLPLLDLILIGVKGYDLGDVLIKLKDRIQDKTMILPLLNGVDIYQRIKSAIPRAIVFPSCVYVGTHIEKPGKVTQRGGACTIHFGNDPENGAMEEWLLKLFDQADIKYNFTANPYTEIWSKFIFIAAYGLVSANYNKTIGEILESEELRAMVTSVMTEIYSLAVKQKIDLPLNIVEDSVCKGNHFPYEAQTSFQRDFADMLKKDERDLFAGAVIRMGKEFGVDTSVTQSIYDSLQTQKPVSG